MNIGGGAKKLSLGQFHDAVPAPEVPSDVVGFRYVKEDGRTVCGTMPDDLDEHDRRLYLGSRIVYHASKMLTPTFHPWEYGSAISRAFGLKGLLQGYQDAVKGADGADVTKVDDCVVPQDDELRELSFSPRPELNTLGVAACKFRNACSKHGIPAVCDMEVLHGLIGVLVGFYRSGWYECPWDEYTGERSLSPSDE